MCLSIPVIYPMSHFALRIRNSFGSQYRFLRKQPLLPFISCLLSFLTDRKSASGLPYFCRACPCACVCVHVRIFVQFMKELNDYDLHTALYEHCSVRRRNASMIFNFIPSEITTWRTHKLLRCDRQHNHLELGT